jgi:hypothetical protein
MRNNVLELRQPALGEQICSLYAQINLATFQLLNLIYEFDEKRLYAKEGCKSTAHWLTYRCGIGPAAAREKVRVARALQDLEVIPEAYAQGRVSYSKVRAMTRVAHEKNEQRLLNIALHSTAAQTEKIMRQYRQTLAVKKVEADASTLSYYKDSAGGLVFKGRLSAEHGLLLLKALELVEPPKDVTGNQRKAESLMMVVEQACAGGGESNTSSADRFQVHVDLDESPLAEPLKERLTCDASVVTHQRCEHNEPLPARKTRVVSGPLRRALNKRDGGCRFPGCTQDRFVDAHHIHHWAHGGETKLSNLVLLCRHHHRLVHEEGFRVHRENNEIVFREPSGKVLAPVADQPPKNVSAETFYESEEFNPHEVDPYTLTPQLDRKPPDYRYINWILMLHDEPTDPDHR